MMPASCNRSVSSMSTTIAASRTSLVLMRGLIWAIIGLIYAPLFTGLYILFQAMGLGSGALAPAAAIAGAVGAAFYSARQAALAGTVIGLTTATLLFMMLPGTVALWLIALAAALAGAALPGLLRFPDRCSLQVPGKAMAGLLSGMVCGGLLAMVEPLHPANFSITGVVAFLVSVNGILYSATVGWWLRRARIKGGGRACLVIESLVIGMVAAVAAASLWVVGGPLIGAVDGSFNPLLESIFALIPGAMFGGLAAGAVTGALLEAFGFDWVV